MAVSVALCTYNGSAFIYAQLQSIVNQTHPVDEIVVCDDASTDHTVAVVREFARASAVPVHLVVNEANIGYRLNFSQAISLCKGDVIFLSDQDDVWLPEKVTRMLDVFSARRDVNLAFSDAELVDDDLRPLGYTMWQSIEFNERRKRMVREGQFLQLLMNWSVVTGATAAIRARVREQILPVPGKWVHDAWIAAVVAATGRADFVEAPLILYRQHESQLLGGRRLGIRERLAMTRRRDEAHHLDVADDFAALKERIRDPQARQMIQEKVEHSRVRAAVRQNRFRCLPRVVRELLNGRYDLYSLGLRSAIEDVLL